MEIAPGVHSIGEKKGGRVHAFLFEDGRELTLVDTLFETDAKVVLAYLRRIGRSARDLRHIALTHAHRSHIGGVATLKRLSGATIYSHETEADIVAGRRRARRVTLRQLTPLRIVPFRIGLALGLPRHEPCEVDERLTDEDAVGPLQVVHAPGHTGGHLGFYSPERRVLVAGDAIATWPEFGPGWPRFNEDEERHRATVRRLAGFEVAAVAVGHGEPITERAPDRLASLVW